MARSPLEVADILNRHGDAFLAHHRLSRGQMKVIGAIRACRTAALGGHVARCEDCDHSLIAYNSCRNRHCPKCQGQTARAWLERRQADLLPVPYYHVVFTLPAPVAAVAFQNKAVVYDILFRTAADTLLTIAADPKHLGAKIGLTAVLHTWGSAMTHHPHVHIVVPGGGLSPDGSRWIACRPGFFLPVRVLSRLFRRLFLDRLAEAHRAGRLAFRGDLAPLAEADAFAHLAPLRRAEWVVYAKRPFAGPEAVLAYLSRYTHRVAIANSRLISLDEHGVTFRWKDYRARDSAKGREWIKGCTRLISLREQTFGRPNRKVRFCEGFRMTAPARGSSPGWGRRSETSRGGSRGGAATLRTGSRAMGNEGRDGSLGDHPRRCPRRCPGAIPR